MAKAIPSDTEVLALLARKRAILAELDEINIALLSAVRSNTVNERRRRAGAGRPTDDINEWAHQQIVKGNAREDVYTEWLDRKNLPDDNHSRDAFRKMLARREKP